MAFQSTKGSGNVWSPTKDVNGDPRTEATENDILDGYYMRKKENVGEHSTNVYTLKADDGQEWDVWGTKTLNDEMDKVRIGDYIRIQWHGKKLTKKGAAKPEKQRGTTDSFHLYEVFVDKDKKSSQASHSAPQTAAIASNDDDDSGGLPF